jgi:hypothetical protein
MAVSSQLNLVVVAVIAIACIGIEHGNQETIDLMAGQHAAACPENESTPYSPECFDLIAGAFEFEIRWPATAAKNISVTPADAPRGRARLSGLPCPGNNENVPYTSSCIKFLSGWFWHPD